MDRVPAWLVVLLTAFFIAAPAQDNHAASPGENAPGSPAASAASLDGKRLFTDVVGPAFEQVCLECHGGKRTRSGFDLSTREGLLKGGDNGIDVVLQDAEASRLIKMLRHSEDPGMPYKKPPLDEELITNISKWIALGAPYDAPLTAGKGETKSSGNHETLWSVQPLTNAPVPKIESSWIRSPIDAFILARLQEKKLAPAAEADRRTLIRRLTFDLHGLPPTPAEVEAFVNDSDTGAYGKLVDRLLASPRYGERWGRHWLDVVHYADNHGYDKDQRRPNAWPYRDYVIQSLNADKPYGRFAAEQIAGDVLFPEDPAGIAATGFIVAGPWDLVGHIELKEGTTDKKITRVLDRDDMVANTMSTFCSLTVHCARCHNHKFDPITQKDYYSLQAVFAGIDRADRLYDPDPRLHRTRAALVKEQNDLETTMAQLLEKRADVSSSRIRAIDSQLAALDAHFSCAGQLPPTGKGFQSKISHSRYQTKWVQVDLGQPYVIDQIALLPVHWKHGDFPGPGYGFPPRFKIELSDEPDFRNPSLVADETAADLPNPGDAPYCTQVKQVSGRYIRVTATRLWRENVKTNDWLFALSELIAISDGHNVARGAVVSASDSHNDSPAWHPRNLVDGASSRAVLYDPSPTDGYRSQVATNMDAPKWVQLDLGQAYPIDHVALMPARPRDKPEEVGYGFPVRFRIEASNDPEFKVAEVIADKTSGDVENPGRNPMSFPCRVKSARYVRITPTQLWKAKDKDEFVFALSEVQVLSGERNIAREATVSARDSAKDELWRPQYLVDGFSSLTAMRDLSPGDGYLSETATNATTPKWIQFDLGGSKPIDEIALVPARAFDEQGRLGYGFPAKFKIEVSDRADLASPAVVADYSQTNFPNPGLQTQTFGAKGLGGRFVRITATELWRKDEDQFAFALGEVEITSRGKNLAPRAIVTASDSAEKERWGKRFVADGFNSITHAHEPEHPYGYSSARARKPNTPKWVEIDLGRTVPVDLIRIFPARSERSETREQSADKVGLSVSLAEANEKPALALHTNLNWRSTEKLEVKGAALPARYIRITATRLSGSKNDYRLRLGEVQIMSEGRNVAEEGRVRALDSDESADWSTRFLVDGRTRHATLGNDSDVWRSLNEQASWEKSKLRLEQQRNAEVRRLVDDSANGAYDLAGSRLAELDTKLADLPPQQPVFAASHDFPEEGTLTAPRAPRPVHLLARGDVNQPGDLMRPAALACVRTLTNEFDLKNPSNEGERRADLALWITDPRNAITWRSIVNRVWAYHFGRGLVDTPNDFGNMGSSPTHPELLDYLAKEFLAHGQSLKWLHRQILMSATYRQASTYSEAFARIDSGNQFLWRMNRERLDAEEVRDSILSVSGKLNLKAGGPGFDLFEFKDAPSPHYLYDRHAVDDPNGFRRSIYRFIVRSVPDPFMETLDCADPSQSVPVRNTTITALQALSLLNNPFVVRMSEFFAERLKGVSSEPSSEIEQGFLIAFGREPSPGERDAFASYCAKYGLANTCRLIFNSNEFLFVD